MSKFQVLNYIDNLNRVAQFKSKEGADMKFDVKYSWGGFVDNISPNLLPNWASTGIINGIPQGSYLEKMMGSEKVGTDNISNKVGLRIGEFFDNFGNYNLVKIIKNDKGENRILILKDQNKDLKFNGNENWADITPIDGIGNKNNYNFASWRNQLYFVNGGEFQFQTKKGGVMRYDPTLNPQLEVIDTGFGTSNLPNSTGADGGTPFYPNTIAFKNDVMYLGGNERFPQQIKFSELSNPYNIVGSLSKPFLGLLDTPPTASDITRPSTFLLNQNGDQITGLLNANGFLWIITNRRFYAYSANEFKQGLPAGLLWLDTLQEHKARTGAYSQKGISQKDQFFDFISTNTIKPSISTIVPIISQDRIDNVLSTKSDFIEDTMRKIKWDDVALGNLGFGSDAISFYSGAKCQNDLNNITLAGKRVDNIEMFSKITYINAVDWLAGDYETYWLSTEGDVYRLTPDNYNIIKDNETKNYDFVWQSGKLGVAKNDTDFSEKKLQYIYLVCCSDLDVELDFQIATNRKIGMEFEIDTNTGEKRKINKDTICSLCEPFNFNLDPDLFCAEITECSCEDDLQSLFIHKNAFLWHTLIQVEDKNIQYNTIQARLIAKTKGYFAIHQIGFIYKKLSPIDNKLLSQPILEKECLTK